MLVMLARAMLFLVSILVFSILQTFNYFFQAKKLKKQGKPLSAN